MNSLGICTVTVCQTRPNPGPWLALAPLIGVAGWMLDGIFIGATLTRDMRNAMIRSVAVFVAAVLILPPFWGNHGLWAALMALNTARAITMLRRYGHAEDAATPPRGDAAAA